LRQQLLIPALIISGLAILIFFGLQQKKSQSVRMGYKPAEAFESTSSSCVIWLMFAVFLGYILWVLYRGLNP
jgi:hypothetical protein